MILNQPRVLFFAGNEDHGQGETFHDDSDWLYATLPTTYTGQRVYFCSDQCTLPYQFQDIAVAHDATLYELTFGGLLASYVGHSSWHQWAVDPVTFAPMFHVDHMVHLRNGGMLPVVLEMTCYTSDFSYPDGDTFDESLLRHADGGAVATWGSTTLGVTTGHGVLHREFFDQVFKQGTTELGPVTEAAKADLFGRSIYLDLLDTFVLLGDPAMNLNTTTVGWDHRVLLPAALRGWSPSAR